MTGILILAVLALAIVAALEYSHRRHATGVAAGSWTRNDRDVARTKLDLLALAGSAKPFTHKPATTPSAVVHLRRARLHTPHGRHAA